MSYIYMNAQMSNKNVKYMVRVYIFDAIGYAYIRRYFGFFIERKDNYLPMSLWQFHLMNRVVECSVSLSYFLLI